MSILRVTGTQVGFVKSDFLYFVLDRSPLTQRQARTLAEDVLAGYPVEFEIIDYNDQDFSRLNELRTDFEVLR